MIKRMKRRKSISMLLILSMLVFALPNQAYAASDVSYLNTETKYLYLGDRNSEIFRFNLLKQAQEKGSSYYWYVKEDKGDPEAVSVDSRTGLVTAKRAGTAYIRCKITRNDGSVIRPEAKVIVRNNITGVKINNLPKNMTIAAGAAVDFNRTITDTAAGKRHKTEGITRWEITGDTAGVITADDKGIVFPTKEGQFRIRAVSFESIGKYKLWLMNKEKYKDVITAASEWQTIKVTKSDGSAVVNTQGQLDKALASEDLNKITLLTEEPLIYEIKNGDYSSKALIVDAPNADIKNYGVFKDITVKAIKDTTWIEYANGNVVHLLDKKLHFVIDSSADIKQITVEQSDSTVDLEIHGKVGLISVLSPSTINLTGDSLRVPVVIESGAGGSLVATSVPMDLTLNADAEIKLNQGSEGSGIDKKASSIEVKLENNTGKPATITTNKTGAETVAAGESKTSNEATAPTPGTAGGYPGSSDVPAGVSELTISPHNMVVAVSGSALSVLVAIASPENAIVSEVTWSSMDESIATVENDGTVIPISVGVTTVIATAAGKTALAYVNVVASVTGSAIQIGMPQSAGSDIALELAKGAASDAGGQLLGWGLKKMGVGFEDQTQTAIDKMAEDLNKISDDLDNLSNQMNQLSQQIITSEYNIRVGDMGQLLSNITSIKASLDDFVSHPIKNNPTLLENSRNEIITNIKSQLIGNETVIYDQLMGTQKESLYKLWSRVVKGNKRFLNSEDSAKVQSMYDYFEMMQTTMLELEVEYYHAIGEGGENCNNIYRILDAYDKQVKEQRSLFLRTVPENAMLDTKQNIMIYKGYYYYRDPIGGRGYYSGKPLHSTVGFKEFSRECDNMGFNNWKWIDYDDLYSWITDGKGQLYNYLIASGWDMPMDPSDRIGIREDWTIGDAIYSTDIFGYNVASGEEVSDVIIMMDGSAHDADNYTNHGDVLQYKYYWIRVRDMDKDEIGNYFW